VGVNDEDKETDYGRLVALLLVAIVLAVLNLAVRVNQ
jgi:hypothetical protein